MVDRHLLKYAAQPRTHGTLRFACILDFLASFTLFLPYFLDILTSFTTLTLRCAWPGSPIVWIIERCRMSTVVDRLEARQLRAR